MWNCSIWKYFPYPSAITNPEFLDTSSSICIDVYYHIVRKNDGTGGFDPAQLDNVNNILNQAYNPHNLYINEAGYSFINNSTYYNIDDPRNSSTEFDALIQINNQPNAINIYIVNNALSYEGRANGVLSQALVIEQDWADTNVVSHEVGHCLDLYHTFHGTAAGTTGCPEAIDGSNCSTCGDLVCDTPADANIENNGGYNPDMDNIMSYYYPFDQFTNGQAERIRNAFATSSLLQQVVSNSCSIPELTGSSIICDNETKTYNLLNGGSSVTWEVSDSLQIIESSNTYIKVKPAGSGLTVKGENFIKAVLPSETIERKIWVGTPDIYTFNPDGSKNYMGRGYSYPVGHSTRSITVRSDIPNPIITYTWEMFPTDIQWSSHQNKATFSTSAPGNYVLSVKTNSNECGFHRMFFTITIGNNYNFAIYPNPASENLSIEKSSVNQFSNLQNPEFGTDQNIYELYNFNNKLILKDVFKGLENIDVSSFKKGRYILKIISDDQSETHHIIIN